MAIEIGKSLRHGVLLRMSRSKEPRWFEIQYERPPYFCFGCGVIGHSEVECLYLAPRNDLGKLPYDV